MSDDARYSIRLASRMSGVSAHTLRMWERRYGYPEPVRTEGGARRYTEADVTRLKLISQALETGYRAGDVVGKSAAELREIIAEQVPMMSATAEPPRLDQFLSAIRKDDVSGFDDLLAQAVAALGPRRFMVDVVQPLAVAIGNLWSTNEIAVRQEHLASHQMGTRLRSLMSSVSTPQGPPRVVLTTLPNEHHGLALDMVALYLAINEATPIPLGVSTPVREIAGAAMSLSADIVGLSVSAAASSSDVIDDVNQLMGELPRRVELWLGGEGAKRLDTKALGAHGATSWDEIDERLAAWREEHRRK